MRLVPARSIEETGLDGGFSSPHESLLPGELRQNTPVLGKSKTKSSIAKAEHHAKPSLAHICSKCQHEEKIDLGISHSKVHADEKGHDVSRRPEHYFKVERSTLKKDMETGNDRLIGAREYAGLLARDGNVLQVGVLGMPRQDVLMGDGNLNFKDTQNITSFLTEEQDVHGASNNNTLAKKVNTSFVTEIQNVSPTAEKVSKLFDRTPLVIRKKSMLSSYSEDSVTHATLSSTMQGKIEEEIENIVTPQPSKSVSSTLERMTGRTKGIRLSHSSPEPDEEDSVSSKEVSTSGTSSKMDARSRWKRAGHSVTFMNRMAAGIRSASTDLIEDKILQQAAFEDDAGGVGAAAFEGAKTVARSRSKGRKGMEGLLVRQNRGFITFFQDFYVACLKMPIGLFLVAVFLAPLVLGLLFTPLYLLDVDGLSFNGVVPEDATTSPLVSATQRCLAFLNIFLYALSLSTTFGGAPVAARSPFCLLVANVNTLLAQFLFVFLSGAVFARMSQPSYPIRCSKKAIIKTDDLLPVLGLEQKERYKTFAVRLVLTGPSPCELVDAKICLTFRIFVTLPSGSVFCSTQDLEVVRPEVSYLRYGLMVRHIIDEKSPVYGHTMESLCKGDASFSLTVMGMERTSMQPVFHLEDYFVCDDDVVWEGDYEDFIHINDHGQRVLDHSRIDLLKPMKAAALASQAVTRMKNLSEMKNPKGGQEEEIMETESRKEGKHPLWRGNWPTIRKRTLFKSMSTSFTRAMSHST